MSEDSPPEYADPIRYAELTGFETEWRDLWWNRDFLELMCRRWNASEVRSVLDVGCGAGHWGRNLLRHLPADATLVGVDREPKFVELATRQADERRLGDRCKYRPGTAETLPFEEDTFDLVTCQTVLMHVPDPAAVIREMRRVAKAGGLIVAAEPDNLATTMAMLNTSPPSAPADVLALIEFQQICERGKMALGEGNSSIGGLLPGMFAEAGLGDVRTYSNDNCPTLLPPYDAEDQRVELSEHRSWFEQEVWAFTGTRADSWRSFEAGGGSAAAFERFWNTVTAHMRAFLESTAAGRFQGARGVIHYLVSGRA